MRPICSIASASNLAASLRVSSVFESRAFLRTADQAFPRVFRDLTRSIGNVFICLRPRWLTRPIRQLGSVPCEGNLRSASLNRDFRLDAALGPRRAGIPACYGAQNNGQCCEENLVFPPRRDCFPFENLISHLASSLESTLFRSRGKRCEIRPFPPGE